MLNDQQQRNDATDPSHSYIVQAPAGSGKTEILTQRFLRLLSHVDSPEQIVALTFTRKAANEMRERILLALHHAQAGDIPSSDHQKTTYTYAKQALDRDHHLKWQLLQQPNRLRIMTIDALCQFIAHAIPLNPLHYANINEHPQALYLQAARACLHFACDDKAHRADLKILLQHLDNRQDLLITLFAQLLSQRDQWLTPIYLAKHQNKATFEQALAWIETHELSVFCQTIPKELQQELMSLVKLLLSNRAVTQDNDLKILEWHQFDLIDRPLATILASLLLTSTQTLRKAFDHHIGLKRDSCDPNIYDHLKASSKRLLSTLQDLPDFLQALISVSQLPAPQFAPSQWQVLQALLNLLPLLVAHLQLQCHDNDTIDFIGIAQQARLALSEDQTPTDLALYLDHQIQHLLIDEFQDTSIQQFELLSQLVRGWEPNDGRTLFVVGDPMQSIYRFRAAEVGLFLRAQRQGIGSIALKALSLSTNFRSSKTLVYWVNQQFKTIFPAFEDIASGAISFHPSSPIINSDHPTFVQAFSAENAIDEAQVLVDKIKEELNTYAGSTVAILVRSRRQLRAIIKVLHEQQVPFQGIDIDLLANLPHLRDIWALTQALLMPANRLAWLTFLRSPWCGFTLHDLLAIAQQHKSIYIALSLWQDIPTLSEDAQHRASYIYKVMHHALKHRQQQSLVDWLLTTLEQLHIKAILTPAQQEDLEQYWLLIKQFEVDGQISDIQLFQAQFNNLYSQKVTPSRLQIMTIHKSKGLEFDCVFLPGLGASLAHKDKPLIRWLTLPTHQTEDIMIISPIKAAEDEVCLLYDYLGRLDDKKSHYESQRLLYVALTRAKHRLYLFDHYKTIRQGSFSQMLIQQTFTTLEPATKSTPDATESLPLLWRLPISYYQQSPVLNLKKMNTSPLTIADSTPRLIGIVTHEILQWICTFHPQKASDIPWQLAIDQLMTMGFIEQSLSQALAQIKAHISALIEDARGQWIIKARSDEQNEFELLTEHGESSCIIDRTFTEAGVRWIIDFKTGQPDEQSLQSHHNQLNHYAELLRQNPRQIIRCGLYYLTNLQWIEWEPATCQI